MRTSTGYQFKEIPNEYELQRLSYSRHGLMLNTDIVVAFYANYKQCDIKIINNVRFYAQSLK
jgi:hypothetical protein